MFPGAQLPRFKFRSPRDGHALSTVFMQMVWDLKRLAEAFVGHRDQIHTNLAYVREEQPSDAPTPMVLIGPGGPEYTTDRPPGISDVCASTQSLQSRLRQVES
jgi:hypothetical protein